MILIIGYGNMGKKYGSILNEMNRPYDTLDEHDNIDEYELSIYTHIIISCPNHLHAEYYKKIREKSECRILIEKPCVILKKDLWILLDKNVFCGMIRRFHPLTKTLQNLICTNEIISCQAIKCGPKKFDIDAMYDLGIHSIDIFKYLKYPRYRVKAYYNPNLIGDIVHLKLKHNVIVDCDFVSSKIQYIYNNEINTIFLNNKHNPLKEQLESFLDNKDCCSYEAHKELLEY